jgi:hypothetical protein
VPVLIIQGKENLIDIRTAEADMKVPPRSSLLIFKNCVHDG